MKILRYLLMMPTAFIVGGVGSRLLSYFLFSVFGQSIISSVIIVLICSFLFAQFYMSIGLLIADSKSGFVKFILAFPFFLIMCLGIGLVLAGVVYFDTSGQWDLTGDTSLSFKWEATISIAGYLYGLYYSFSSKGLF